MCAPILYMHICIAHYCYTYYIYLCLHASGLMTLLHLHLYFWCRCYLSLFITSSLPPTVLRITSLSSSSTNSWVNVSSSPVAEGEDTISFLILPQNIANLSNCSSAVISGVVSGLHLILPSYSNFSLSTDTAQKDRILSGLWWAIVPMWHTRTVEPHIWGHLWDQLKYSRPSYLRPPMGLVKVVSMWSWS